MKKLLLLLIVIVSLKVSAQTSVDPHKKWAMVVEAIGQVESSGRSNAVSRDGLYVGYLQISKILVRACNIIAGYNKYTYNDRYNKQKSIDMFVEFMEHYNPEGNIEKAIRLWNSGDFKCMQHKAATERYYQRVMSHYTQLAKAK